MPENSLQRRFATVGCKENPFSRTIFSAWSAEIFGAKMSSYGAIEQHRSMVFDTVRNDLYARAIRDAVSEDSVVLDLGAGLGLHGLVAACAGARKVYLVEPSPIIEVTRQIVKKNGLSDKVECLTGKIEEIVLPEKVDIILSVFTGNFLLTEDLLPSLFLARDRFLKAGGVMIPDRAVMEVVPVSVPEYYGKRIDTWGSGPYEIDLSTVRPYAANTIYYNSFSSREVSFLAGTSELMELDFSSESHACCDASIKVPIEHESICHGWLGWFKARQGKQWLSTSPFAEKTHWRQVFLPLDQAVPVKPGDTLGFSLHRPEFGEWSWLTVLGNETQRQSTFLSEPLTPARVAKKSTQYKGVLNSKGRLVKVVLEQLDGDHSTEEIARLLFKSHPGQFADEAKAQVFIIKLIERFAI